MLSAYSRIISLSCILLILSGCNLFDKPELSIPDTYDGGSFAANAATELALLNQLETLVSAMKEGRDPAVSLSADELSSLYQAGTPSLRDYTNTYYQALIDDWFVEMEAASGTTFDPQKAPQGNGGVFEGYLYDENALELEQMVDKGLYAALLYYQAYQLLSQPVNEATADRLLALFGAHPDMPNSDNASLHPNPDRFAAKYAARRDANDGSGIYARMKANLIQLKTAAPLQEDYPAEVDDALLNIQAIWEEANAATMINYLFSATANLSGTNPTEAQIGDALHSYSEAVGFLHGWRQLPLGARTITDAQIDLLLALLQAPAGSAPMSYRFVQDRFAYVADLQEVIQELQQIYGFTDNELQGFRKNWVSEQNR